jgi:hypothetical protein
MQEQEFVKTFIKFKRIHDKLKNQINKELGSEFSVFQYINFNEVNMSSIFKDLLDPKESHGQGALFLNEFLELLRSKLIDHPILSERDHPAFTKCFSALTEALTYGIETNRRIDILLKWGQDFAIAIENKPYAIDQENQLSDYSKHLSKIFKENYILIYLSRRDKEIKEDTFSKLEIEKHNENKQFVHLYFEDVIDWLENSLKKVESSKIKHFIKDLIQKIKIDVKQENINTMNQNELVEFLNESEENIVASFSISDSLNALKVKIANEIVNIIKKELIQNETIVFEQINTNDYRINLKISQKNNAWGNYSCGLYDYDGHGLHYAINLGKDENDLIQTLKTETSFIEWSNKEGVKILWMTHPYNVWYNNANNMISFKNEFFTSNSTADTFGQLKSLIAILNKHLCNK